MKKPTEVEQLRKQQSALAAFGTFAFREENLERVLTEAARICAEGLNVPFAKICRYRKEEDDLFVVAGVGWHQGVVGNVVSKADESTTQGRAFISGEPVLLENITENNSYTLPAFYADHKIVSTADVLIRSKQGSWGVLEVDSAEERHFNQHDIIFLTGFANVVAEAVVTSERTVSMRENIGQMKALIAEKDALLKEKQISEIHFRELQAEFLHTSRLNAMGQMTAAIAHELNQPLAAIANYVGALKLTLDKAGGSAAGLGLAQEMIGKAQAQTLRAGKVILNLRNMSEKRQSVRAAVTLEAVVKESMAIALLGAKDAGVTVDFTVAPNLPQVMIDRIQIQQTVFNLIRNSVEAMTLSKERKLTIGIAQGDPGFVEVTIQDTGTGMLPNVVEHLFQPFVTTKAAGMGLGLMICRTLVEANGGRIWRLDGVTGGAAFRFCLPYAEAPIGALPLVA